jgi:hypothetical protein
LLGYIGHELTHSIISVAEKIIEHIGVNQPEQQTHAKEDDNKYEIKPK